MGASLSLASVSATLVTFGFLVLSVGRVRLGANAAAEMLTRPEPWLFLSAVLVIPAIETVVAQLVLIELMRWVRIPGILCVLTSAAVFGLGHYVNGGLGHGAVSFVGGLVFSYAYIAQRTNSSGKAFACAWCAHACHNFIVLYIVMPNFPFFHVNAQ
jgi:hypothetical protein